jgi:type IV secretion system protein VirB5
MSLFKRPAAHYGKSPEPETPYQRAAQVWDERIGSARVQARNWRIMAFGSLFLSAGFAAALVWQSARGTVVPWVVQVDRLGQAQSVAPATADYRPTDPQIAWHLARFIEQVEASRPIRSSCARTGCAPTTGPPIAARRRSTTMPAPTIPSPRSASSRSPSRFRASSAPRRILPRRLDRARYENGQLAGTERWTAILTIVIQTPRDADRLRANPLGIYVNAINWSREMSQ